MLVLFYIHFRMLIKFIHFTVYVLFIRFYMVPCMECYVCTLSVHVLVVSCVKMEKRQSTNRLAVAM
jgi:hypothetical protein